MWQELELKSKSHFVVPFHLYIVKSLLQFNEHIKGAASANLKNVCIFSRLGQTLVQLCRLYFEKGA